jgi:phospholipid/cholesterol/gamma-HCH transport system permease protein
MTRSTEPQSGDESVWTAPGRALEQLGEQFVFYGKSYGWSYRTLLRYKRELVRQIAAITFGTGALARLGGTAAVIVFLNAMTGAEVMVEGYVNLGKIGVAVLTGFFSAYINTRITVPLVTTIGLVATVGAGITAELGARRTSEEIDALEVMAVPPIPYLVTTRILAGMLAVTPLYAVALIVSYGMSRMMAVVLYAQSGGAYDHYFSSFLHATDVLTSYLQVLAMSVVIVSVHSYYGFTTTGGPAGVGRAVGRSVRLSLVLVLFIQFALTLLLYQPNALRISR